MADDDPAEVIRWLASADGQRWRAVTFRPVLVHSGSGWFADVIDDGARFCEACWPEPIACQAIPGSDEP